MKKVGLITESRLPSPNVNAQTILCACTTHKLCSVSCTHSTQADRFQHEVFLSCYLIPLITPQCVIIGSNKHDEWYWAVEIMTLTGRTLVTQTGYNSDPNQKHQHSHVAWTRKDSALF